MERNLDSFSLKGNDKEFDNKKKEIFDQLEHLENKYNNNLINRFSTDDNIKECHRHGDKNRATSNSSFKVPCTSGRTKEACDTGDKLEASVRKRRGNNLLEYQSKEDYKQKRSSWNFSSKRKTRHDYNDPKKWTKYSLEDVEIGSESQNKSIAFEFLANQWNKNKEVEPEKVINLDDKITFSKPLAKDIDVHEAKPKMYGNVFRMPECVVGSQMKQKSRKKHADGSRISAGGSVQLEFAVEDAGDEANLGTEISVNDNTGKTLFKKSKQRKSIRKRNVDEEAAPI